MVHSNSIPVLKGHRRVYVPPVVRSALLAACLLAALTAQAQPSAKAARPDPLDPKAAVPMLKYESSFAQYRRLADEKPVSWRDANDTVTRIGGWRVYAREAQQPDPAPPNTPNSTSNSTPAIAPVTTPANPATPAPATQPAGAPPVAKPVPMPAGHAGHKSP